MNQHYLKTGNLKKLNHGQLIKNEPVDQRICPETFAQFLDKYLQGRIISQKFAQQFDAFYRQRINFDNLNEEQIVIIKKLVIVADNYAPDLINN